MLIDTIKSSDEQRAFFAIADSVLLPTCYSPHATDGLSKTMRDVQSVREASNPGLGVLGAIPWAVVPGGAGAEKYIQATELALDTRHARDWGRPFSTLVVRLAMIGKSHEGPEGRTILQARPNHRVCRQIRDLAAEFDVRLQGKPQQVPSRNRENAMA